MRRWLAISVVLLLVAAACGAGSDDSTGDDVASDETVATATPAPHGGVISTSWFASLVTQRFPSA